MGGRYGLKIAYITPQYYPHIGGVEYVVKSLSNSLTSLGHEVSVFTLNQKPALPPREFVDGVQIKRFQSFDVANAYFFPSPSMILSLLQRQNEYDIWHAHNVHSLLVPIASWVRKKTSPRRFFVTAYYHGGSVTKLRNLSLRLYRPVIRRALTKGVDGVFAVSSLEASYLQRDFSIDPVIVENGVDADIASCKWTPEPGRILYAGRVERYKNIDLAAQMAQGLRKLGYEARLRVIGEGSYLDSLRTKLKGLEVEFSPFLPRREYLEQLCKAALFANLSTHESYPQSVNEAQAVGVPVLLGDPWGHNFDSRSRTMTVKPHQLMEESFLREVGEFMKYAPAQPAPQTPFWDDVVKTKILRAYEESTIDP